jgi:hypothetical protein
MVIFWVVILYGLEGSYWYFAGTYCLHHKMETLVSTSYDMTSQETVTNILIAVRTSNLISKIVKLARC